LYSIWLSDIVNSIFAWEMPMTQLPDFLVTTVEADTSRHATAQPQFIQRQINLPAYAKQAEKGLILYFYPKDHTSGCSVQAQDFSQHLPQLQQLGYQVIGVSRDSVKSHEKFIANQQINFALVSDTDEQLCQYFDIIAEKKLYGKVSLGVVRSTLIFDPSGKLVHEMRNVRAKGHMDKLLAILLTL
jgi:peroxiredoxin Q/BCP